MHVIVTGASSGIGEAIARQYAASGAKLTLVARRRERLEKLAHELQVETNVVVADLSAPSQLEAWYVEAQAALGPADVLVNNAAHPVVAPVLETDPEVGERSLHLNVHTPLRLMLLALPGMVERRSGAIVNICSLSAITPTPGMLYYNASKAALAAASESLRWELRESGVHVLTVYPGPVHTAMAAAVMGKFGPETLAVRILPKGSTEVLARLVQRAVERRTPRLVYPGLYRLNRWFTGTTNWITCKFAPSPSGSDEPGKQ